jgi:hypothetical protein
VGDRAADGAAMTDLRVAHERGDVGEQAALLPDQVGALDVVMAREAADAELIALLADVGELGDAGRRRRAPPAWRAGAS